MIDMPVLSAALVSFAVTAGLGFFVIPLLRRLKYGQTILDIGPNWHKNKQGTPTMGGIIFAVGISLGIITGFIFMSGYRGEDYYGNPLLDNIKVIMGVLSALAFGAVGFVDDFIKVAKKRNLGLSAKQKLVMQFLISAIYILALYVAGDTSTIVIIPFIGQINLGLLYYPLVILGITYMINVVNFTDGLDGLCTSVTFVSSLGFLVISSILYVPLMGIFSVSVAAGCLGFLIWNLPPAKVFMGDTGSMFLGGCIVAMAFGLNIPVFLIFMGFVYIMEGLSVIIQTLYFKATRKIYGKPRRLFKMSPIHHHFEMSGWTEGRIDILFSIIQAVACIIAVAAVYRI